MLGSLAKLQATRSKTTTQLEQLQATINSLQNTNVSLQNNKLELELRLQQTEEQNSLLNSRQAEWLSEKKVLLLQDQKLSNLLQQLMESNNIYSVKVEELTLQVETFRKESEQVTKHIHSAGFNIFHQHLSTITQVSEEKDIISRKLQAATEDIILVSQANSELLKASDVALKQEDVVNLQLFLNKSYSSTIDMLKSILSKLETHDNDSIPDIEYSERPLTVANNINSSFIDIKTTHISCCACKREGYGLMITCKSCFKEFHVTCGSNKQKNICKICL